MSGYSSRTRLSEEDRPLLAAHLQSVSHDDASYEDLQFGGPEAREKLEKGLIKKLDVRMGILVLIYILNYIDRNNAAAARLYGFEEDLGLEGSQFASILSILYVGYILMQIPSNMFLSQIGRPSIYLPFCMIIWGGVSFCTGSFSIQNPTIALPANLNLFSGFTSSYYGALFARFVLGFVEAAFFPGALYLIARWYKRNELSQRTAYLTCGSLISNAFGSLIASGILDTMEGVLGFAAWRWLFFVEGGVTVLVAILALFILPDYPETRDISWLTPAEHALAKWRMLEDNGGTSPAKPNTESDQGSSKQNDAMAGFMLAVVDWKVYYLAIGLFLYALTLSFHLYFPTLTATMGYGPIISLLLCVPPWMVATAYALWLSGHSDKTGDRCMHIVSSLAIGVFGFLLSTWTMNLAVRYFSMFLMAQMFAGFICYLAWVSSTVSNPPIKRAVALALVNTISQSGNIVGSYVWIKEWGPTYNKSYVICITAAVGCALMSLWLRSKLKQLNSEMDKEDEGGGLDGARDFGKWRYHT